MGPHARSTGGHRRDGGQRRRLAAFVAGWAALSALAAPAACAQPNVDRTGDTTAGTREAAGGRVVGAARDAGGLLAPARIAALPGERRAAWEAYLARSDSMRALDSAAAAAELRETGQARLTRATHGQGFDVEKWMTPDWLATDSAARVAERLLSFQAPNGGWSKRVDMMARARRPGESWASEGDRLAWVSTIDNGATTAQLEFLARIDSVRPDPRYEAAYLRGLRWLLAAQMPSGCWPQTYPLQGSYHDAATFNDDATVRAASILRAAANGSPAVVPDSTRAAAAAGVRRAIGCMLDAQVVIDGTPTVWGQQHDPLTLAPIAARSYEPASLASQESASIVRFLMREPDPDPRLVAAIYDAVDWFRRTAQHGYTYTFDGGLVAAPGEGPLWARLYELGTDRPIFSNRDGVVRYDWNELTDRRRGYAWYSYTPLSMLKAHAKWARRHPRPAEDR